MAQSTIHLIFKTHLDIGFTDHAAKVRAQYHAQFLPQAMATGEHFFNENPNDPQFIWTTGAWLIWDFLNTQDADNVRRLEQAIERGLIAWHGLPFTTHTELMTPAIFRAGLSYAQELDKRFGRKTIAAKMTDVPGHTLGMVPLLAEAGIRFLHLGVNTASPVPDVPPIFRWQAPDGSEVVVMYQGSYGATDFPAGSDIGLGFAHTNDNAGPQSVGQVVELLRDIRTEHAGAVIKASTLDAFGAEMWARRASFPVVSAEIGDSWIHGAGSDPIKLARFHALQRLYRSWGEVIDDKRRAFGRGLAMVAEHTWGVDIKTYLRDDKAWDRVDFDAARKTDYRFAYAEQSWDEQRAYLDAAVAELDAADQIAAHAVIEELQPEDELAPVAGDHLVDSGWMARLDPMTGDVTSITAPNGMTIETAIGYRHESYDSAELQKHLDAYLQHRATWAILDHDKPGLAEAKTARTARFAPEFLGIEDAHRALLSMSEDAAPVGAPPRCELAIRGLSEDTVELTVVLREKPANRMPEAGFVEFRLGTPAETRFRKMGLWHAAENMVRKGGGQLQSVEAVELAAPEARLTVTPLDASLLAPAGTPFMPFQPEQPDFAEGIRFNLYNNKWGTNFPMWWEGSIAFRFVLQLSPTK